MKCARCGFEGEPFAFQQRRPTFRSRPRDYCLLCDAVFTGREQWISLVIMITAPILLISAGLLVTMTREIADHGWILVGIGCGAAMLPALIAAHEAGHVLGAWLMRIPIFGVHVGTGPRLWSSRIRGVPVHVHAVMIRGLVVAAPRDRRFARARFFGFIVGGLAVHLVLIIASLLLIRSMSIPLIGWGAIAHGCLWANAFLLFSNLLPMVDRGPFGEVPADGLALWRCVFGGRAQVDGWLEASSLLATTQAIDTSAYEDALQIAEQGLEQFPESEGLISQHAIALIEVERVVEAREVFESLLRRSSIEAWHQVIYRHNIAYCSFLLDDRERLDEADRFSRDALEALPWMPELLAGRGALLVWKGAYAEAMPLLQSALDRGLNPVDYGTHACVRAMAQAGLGDHDAAAKDLARAETFDAGDLVLRRANDAVEQTKSGGAPKRSAAE